MLRARHILLLGSAFAAALLFGQSERGTITGTVVDATGAVVPGARVAVTNLSTNAVSETGTTEAGSYTAASLPVGQYTVRVEKDGFKPSIRSGVTLNAATTVRIDVALEIGTAQQAIEVSATVQLLSTESAKTR